MGRALPTARRAEGVEDVRATPDPTAWSLSGMHVVGGEVVRVRSVRVPLVSGQTTASVAVEFERSVIGLATFHRPTTPPPGRDVSGTVALFVDSDWPQLPVFDLLWKGLWESARTVLLPVRRAPGAPDRQSRPHTALVTTDPPRR